MTAEPIEAPDTLLTPSEGRVQAAIDLELTEAEELAVDINRLLTQDPGYDFDQAVALLDRLRTLRDAIKVSEDHVAKVAWELRGDRYGGNVVHPELGSLDLRYGSRKTRWDDEATVERVIAARMEEVGGEVTDPAVVVGWITEAASIGYWRKGVLKDHGIDPEGEELVSSERGDPAIKVNRPAGPNRLLMPPG